MGGRSLQITCKCGKEYIGGTGRRRIKEHERDLQPACSQNWVVSEQAFGTGPVPVWDHYDYDS